MRTGSSPPLGIMGAALALAVGVRLIFDPFRTHVPLCIVNHLTGIECPGRGALRAVHSLLAGDLLLALRSNLLIILAIPLTAIGMGVWTPRRARGLTTELTPSSTTVLVLTGVVLVFTVPRNLPAFWFLAPISYVGG
ncbi:DUF2752 domain-containing protein [Brachybacterium sp. GPGPB12]|uniref:DUF2752 domain-containing protein n=1 Tax=Brachybacterium sp. GPGPB12 TaxID=3023517 RepID=UPI0031344E21